MKRMLVLSIIVAVLAVSSVSALATAYYFTPNPSNLDDLVHQDAYRWGINFKIPAHQTITSACLSFSKIYDWTNEENWLYCSMLNDKPGHPFAALTVFTDNEAYGDYFDNWKWGMTDLITYHDLSTTPTNLSYNFTPSQLTALTSYLSDGNFAIALDPDCHFYNCGVKLCITTSECTPPPINNVPEPSTIMLVLGGLGMAGASRFALKLRK